MKITDEIIIRDSEKELISAVVKNIDWRTVEKIIREKHGMGVTENIRYRQGDIVSHDDQVAYRIHFDVTVPFSMLFNRAGEHVSINAPEDSGTEIRHPGKAENEALYTENEILEELTREMDALDQEEEEPIELTEVVGTLPKETAHAPNKEESFFPSAVNG